ncbi:LacI family DNA-binding transcriptional regulator [Lentilactobacillus senioris]|uniref:LacI family DNA-binding transcriptional regulator n=1 Tax=Lentilactobacillus senioris TaxID=931534 RepID=UPI00227E3061|nr:LacI family DNA-binding transcriptional regulator [Lentilactobacillus senioris]MCY9806138.1 LacI family DNA-binding transcriptional regulator [Lentilactobacillus senioris]
MHSQITIKEIATEAGVSVATVSRALNDSPRVTPATKQRIQQIANQLGYRVNDLARSIRVKKTFTLGVVISNILTSFFTEIIDQLEEQALQNHYQIIIARTNEDAASEQQAISALQQRMVDGLIVATADVNNILTNLDSTTPTVFIDRQPQEVQGNFDVVLTENTEGAAEIVTTMLHQGAQRIGFINSPVSTTSTERLQGYRQALSQTELPLDDRLVLASTVDYANVADLTGKLVYNLRCDGIIAADNQILLHILHRLTDRDFPQIILGSFDDSPWLQVMRYPMVIAKQPTAQIAKVAFDLLMKRIQDPNRATNIKRVKTTLVRY